MNKKDIEDKVEEIGNDLKENYEEKPIVKYMLIGFGVLFVALLGYTIFASSTAEGSPRTDAATVIIQGGK